MFRIDDATAATSLPTPETAGTEGYFTEGNPTAGTPATNVRGSWLNMIQEELCAILAAAGITRSKTSYSQVNSALQKMYAPVVGTVRNLAMSVTAASATATLTADQIVVASALNGQTYILSSFNKTINLATTGAGGMDTGAAPASSFVGIYAIYNPTTGTAALLATNATAAVQPNVYGGANLPAGYTASALLTVVPTNSSSLVVPCVVQDRSVDIANVTAMSTNTVAATPTLVNNLAVPLNAKSCTGSMTAGSNSTSTVIFTLYSSAASTAAQTAAIATAGSASITLPLTRLKLSTAQRMFYTASNSAGTPTFTVVVNSYEI